MQSSMKTTPLHSRGQSEGGQTDGVIFKGETIHMATGDERKLFDLKV